MRKDTRSRAPDAEGESFGEAHLPSQAPAGTDRAQAVLRVGRRSP
jgi:hypothetical protein